MTEPTPAVEAVNYLYALARHLDDPFVEVGSGNDSALLRAAAGVVLDLVKEDKSLSDPVTLAERASGRIRTLTPVEHAAAD